MNTIKVNEMSVLEFTEIISADCEYVFNQDTIAFSKSSDSKKVLEFKDCSPLYIKFKNKRLQTNELDNKFNEQIQYYIRKTKNLINIAEESTISKLTEYCLNNFPKKSNDEIKEMAEERYKKTLKRKERLECFLNFLSDDKLTEDYYQNNYAQLGNAKENQTKKISIPDFKMGHVIYLFYQKKDSNFEFSYDKYAIQNIIFSNELSIGTQVPEIMKHFSVIPVGSEIPTYKIKDIQLEECNGNKEILSVKDCHSDYRLFLNKEAMLEHVEDLKKGLNHFSTIN